MELLTQRVRRALTDRCPERVAREDAVPVDEDDLDLTAESGARLGSSVRSARQGADLRSARSASLLLSSSPSSAKQLGHRRLLSLDVVVADGGVEAGIDEDAVGRELTPVVLLDGSLRHV